MKFLHIITFAVLVTLTSACSTSKDNSLVYFKNLAGNSGQLTEPQQHKILLRPNDELIINITSSQYEATAMYNVPLGNPATRGTIGQQGQIRQLTYIVNQQGQVELPVIGRIQAAGLTVDQLKETIKAKVSEDVKDPYVRVELVNYYVNVMGEVKTPGRIAATGDRFTVLDALSAAGDMTEYGVRNNVVVIREEPDGTTKYHRLNLNDVATFQSPYFYLQQNDVLYVQPNNVKYDNSKVNQNNAFRLSIAGTIVSVASVLSSLLIALFVK